MTHKQTDRAVDVQKDQPAVVLLSGGLDSSVLLHKLRRDRPGANLYALSFFYGQKHARELECASWQADAAGVSEHQVIDFAGFASILNSGSALVDPEQAVPDMAEIAGPDQDQPATYVPHRNLVMLALAAAYAETKACSDVFYGAQHQDYCSYWDCTTEFVGRLNDVLLLNRRKPVQVHAPLAEFSKTDVLRLGVDLNLDFAHTWTCYRGKAPACGTCSACVERLAAFCRLGMDDPALLSRG